MATRIAATLAAEASATATTSPTASATITNTPAPTTALPTSTVTSPPPAANLPNATRIQFETGATQGVVDADIGSGDTQYYVARAVYEQVMLVILDSPNGDVALSVFGADGSILLDEVDGANTWSGALPASQDYYFGVHGNSQQDFTLNLVLAAPIRFEQGQTSLSLAGRTVNGFAVSYFAYAFEGQVLDVVLEPEQDHQNELALTIFGLTDGQPYVRAQSGVTIFDMTLPSTQYYIIHVVPQGGQEIDYQLTVQIE